MEDELNAVLNIIGQVTDLPHPSPNHIVLDVLFICSVEKGLHHLKLACNEHQITLNDLPILSLLLDYGIDLVCKQLNRSTG